MGFYIYGGCATRDVFSMDELLPKDEGFSVKKYFSRTVPASLCHEPFSMDLGFDSDFYKRLFFEDSAKAFRDFLAGDISDGFLILDFISAVRFNLYELPGMVGTLTPQNKKALVNANKEFEILPCWSNRYMAFHELGMAYFSDFIKRCKNRVILNKIYFSNVCSDGTSIDISVDRYNTRLDVIYNYLERYLDPSLVISFDSSVLVCDVNHKWGKDAFHFGMEYYSCLAQSLRKIVMNSK